MAEETKIYDAIVIGGGPAGATAALVMARAGLSVLVVERSEFPRFHIGESLLPRNYALFRELGLEEAVRALPHTYKRGAEFRLGEGDHYASFFFSTELVPGETEAVNIERAPFDAMLLDTARQAGAEVVHGRAVRKILKLSDGDVTVEVEGMGEVAGRVLLDASGQATVLGKHLGLRKVLPDLRKVACFGHFENVRRREGIEGGFPVIVMCEEGWFWLIPLDEHRTSIGLVMAADAARRLGIPAQDLLAWGISRSPVLQERTADSVFPAETHVIADFSYRCAPYAGPGYFLAGDAATFVDPIFSTGVCLGMMSGARAAQGIIAMQRDGADPDRLRRRYIQFIEGSSSIFFRLVRMYYRHPFRELFLAGSGPLKVHHAVIAALAGNVFPRPSWALRWRLYLFELFVHIQRWMPLAMRRKPFSLMAAEAPAQPAKQTETGLSSSAG